jgi:hypothetical protein
LTSSSTEEDNLELPVVAELRALAAKNGLAVPVGALADEEITF